MRVAAAEGHRERQRLVIRKPFSGLIAAKKHYSSYAIGTALSIFAETLSIK